MPETCRDFPERDQRYLLVDVSVICRHDAGTGIQRVVRAFWTQISAMLLAGIVPIPVFAHRRLGYCYAPVDFLERGIGSPTGFRCVTPRAGDIFLGLDLSINALLRHDRQIRSWKAAGVSLHVMVYDLLPVTGRQWFPRALCRKFESWLNFVAVHCDHALCISQYVTEDFRSWLKKNYPARSDVIQVDWVPLGGDIAASQPTLGLPENCEDVLGKMRSVPTMLMVGTIEPRKGHDQVLDAYDLLWSSRDGTAPALVIVGRPGWMTEKLQHRLRSHPEAGSRLHWFSEATDEFLDLVYAECSGVLAASRAEGYGLPVAEALGHGKAVLARDLPVFREFQSRNISFFDTDDAGELASAIRAFMHRNEGCRMVTHEKMLNWLDCTRILLQTLGIAEAGSNVKKG